MNPRFRSGMLALLSALFLSQPVVAGDSPKDELHWSVCETSAQSILAKLPGAADRKKDKKVYYYDLSQLENLDAGIILRLRTEGDKQVATAKLRPLDASRVRDHWFKQDGFKCEGDRYGTRTVPSCSFDADLSGKSGLPFTDDQRAFIEEYAAKSVGWDLLRKFGPAVYSTWKLAAASEFPDLELERIQLPGGVEFFELSTRTSADQANELYTHVTRALGSGGVTLCAEQESKTRKVLEYFTHRTGR